MHVEEPSAAPARGGLRHGVAAGLLITLGALWAAVGVALIVVAVISLDPTSLPAWVLVAGAPASGTSVLVVALLGAASLAAGLLQAGSGLAIALRRAPWARLAGGAVALIGAAVMLILAITGGNGPSPNLALGAVAAGYLFVCWAELVPS